MSPKLISTRNLNVVLAKHNRLERVTTQIDHASIKANKQKEELMKSPMISTHNIDDVTTTQEKKECKEILEERKRLKKDGPVFLDENGVLVASEKEQEHVEEHMKGLKGKVLKTTEDMNLEMRDEKKIAMAERMEKVRAGKDK